MMENVSKIPVAILGATGSVGQRFIELLHNHPWFEVVAVAASKQSAGKPYRDAVNWLMNTSLPGKIASLIVQECIPNIPCKLVFSALDTSVAKEIENDFAKSGYVVISNASSHRMVPDVPLLIPEVNSAHLGLLDYQKFSLGRIVTNPNCSAIGLSLALKPLHDRFGLEAVHIVTMQAVSGAGYPGVASMDIMDNVIPYIKSEEEKLETEPLKILGSLVHGSIQQASIVMSAQCNRVAVSDGHIACVSLKLKTKPSKNDIIASWREFKGDLSELNLPLSPSKPIYYFDEEHYPQPKLHRNLDKGMAVAVGRLRECSLFDYKFTLLSHNTVRGAAGGAILCGELMYKLGQIS